MVSMLCGLFAAVPLRGDVPVLDGRARTGCGRTDAELPLIHGSGDAARRRYIRHELTYVLKRGAHPAVRPVHREWCKGGVMSDTDALRARIDELMDAEGITVNRSLVRRILETGVELGRDGTERLDLKITSAAAARRCAARSGLFAPYHGRPEGHDVRLGPHAAATTRCTRRPATWRAHAGAAGLDGRHRRRPRDHGRPASEGAGRSQSIGVSIRLPFEQSANADHRGRPEARGDEVLLHPQADADEGVARASSRLPGGFGTLDETFELLTLLQTGKAEPAPIVLLDVPGRHVLARPAHASSHDELVPPGLISPDDLDRVLITDDVEAAAAEITGFFRNYHSLRWVGTTGSCCG